MLIQTEIVHSKVCQGDLYPDADVPYAWNLRIFRVNRMMNGVMVFAVFIGTRWYWNNHGLGDPQNLRTSLEKDSIACQMGLSENVGYIPNEIAI